MHRGVHHVRLKLHEEVVHTRAAVDLQRIQTDARIQLHGVEHVVGLEGEGFEGRADQVVFVHAAGQSHDRAARVGIPMRRAQSGERRHDITARRITHAGREVFAVGGAVDQLELVTEPLDRRARDIDRAFERIIHLAVEPPRDGGEQSVLGEHRLFSRVHQHKTAGAVGVLCLSLIEAGLSEQRRLLIARGSRDRDLTAEEFGVGYAVDTARRAHLGQHTGGDIELF